MNREDVRKLLGGYATGTLSPAEREALFAAALDDQELFDALMKEEALREVLEEPGAKAQLLAALQKPAKQPVWWSWRPLIGAVAMTGIALMVVAIWRGSGRKPAEVMVAEVAKQAPAPVQEAPRAATPPVEQKAALVKSKSRTEPKTVRDERRQEKEKDNAAPAEQTTPSAKGEVQGAAAAAAAAPPAVARQQQVGQIAAPSPMVQQQTLQSAQATQSVAVNAASGINRAAAINGFRAASPAKEISADMAMEKKAVGPLQWSILRGDREVPPGTMLDAGEEVRLRIFSFQPGTITLTEGDKTLASSQVEASKPFDTPAIPFTSPGLRQLRLSLATGAPQPITLTITLNYAR